MYGSDAVCNNGLVLCSAIYNVLCLKILYAQRKRIPIHLNTRHKIVLKYVVCDYNKIK